MPSSITEKKAEEPIEDDEEEAPVLVEAVASEPANNGDALAAPEQPEIINTELPEAGAKRSLEEVAGGVEADPEEGMK